MTIFNPENKEVLTLGECLSPAMEITEQADADQYKAAYIAYTHKQGGFAEIKTAEEAFNRGFQKGVASRSTSKN